VKGFLMFTTSCERILLYTTRCV